MIMIIVITIIIFNKNNNTLLISQNQEKYTQGKMKLRTQKQVVIHIDE